MRLQFAGYSLALNKKGRVKNALDNAPKDMSKKKRLKKMIVQRREFYFEVGLEELKHAIMEAENIDFPRRHLLHSIYKEILRDNHLRSQIRTAINEVLSEPWVMLNPSGKIDEKATKLMAKQWFVQVMYNFLFAEFDGTRLMELDEMHWDEALKNWVFKTISLLPRPNVVPEKGLLLIDDTVNEGIPYREAPFNEWLIEAGEPDNLGELQHCARYAIMKGFSLQDWVRSGEKWSDPILVIRTDATEDEELDEKENFAKKFGANGYAIFNKTDDEVELLERKNADGYKINMELCSYVDAENSKGINGQVATSQENAFVGSSEVQERILKGYTESRLKALTFFINETVLPKLIDINGGQSAYASLKGCTFQPLYFMKPLTLPQDPSQQQKTEDKKQQQGGAGEKKPLTQAAFVSVSSQVAELYAQAHCDCDACTTARMQVRVEMRINIDETIDAAIKRLHQRKIAIGQPDADLWKYNADQLFDAVKQGSGLVSDKIKYGSPEQRMLISMRYNTAVTAAFKVHHNSLEMASKLFDENGKIVPFHKFKKAVKQVCNTYNKNYLQTEYDTAVAAARSGAQWLKFSAKGGKLMYHTQRDGRVRDEHRVLDGTVKSVNDAFWDVYYPPNGWHCRCFVREVDDQEPDKEPAGLPELLPTFRNNPGKSLKIFLDDLPYFEVEGQYEDLARDQFHLPMPLSPAEFAENQRIYETLLKDKDYELLGSDNLSGGFLFKHNNSLASELHDLSKFGKMLMSQKGDAVVIRQFAGYSKSADYIINLAEAELKMSAATENAVKQNIRRAVKQAKHVVLSVHEDMEVKAFRQAVFSRAKQSESLEVLTVIYKGKVTRWTRAEILKGVFNP